MSRLFVGRHAPAQPSLPVCLQMTEHGQAPVGDDEYLEGLREGDRVRVERWTAPYDLVRRFLVLGVVDDGRFESLLMAMSQVAPFGPDVVLVGDQLEWAEARAALARLMERYHRVPPARGLR